MDEIIENIDVCFTRNLDAPAWHKKDTRLDRISAEELRARRFARKVDSLPIYADTNNRMGDTVLAKDLRAIVAEQGTAAETITAIVSNRYCAPEDGYGSLVRLIEPLLDSGILSIVSAGTLRGYKRAYMTCELGKGLTASVTGNDIIKRYWTLTDALDGKNARHSFGSDVRIVCANTLAMANADSVARKSLRHSSGFELRSEAWRDLILAEQASLDDNAATLRLLAQKQIDAAALDLYLRECFGMGEGVDGDKVSPKYAFAVETHDSDPARGTLWGAYNAAQATIQWYGRGGRQEQARMDSLYFGTGQATNQKYLNLALDLL